MKDYYNFKKLDFYYSILIPFTRYISEVMEGFTFPKH